MTEVTLAILRRFKYNLFSYAIVECGGSLASWPPPGGRYYDSKSKFSEWPLVLCIYYQRILSILWY